MDEYISRLDDSGLSLMVYDGDSVIFQSASKGVRPHLEAIDALGTRLKGTTMVDKIVGRAAALLILYSGAAEVHAGVISRGGRELLEHAGVKVAFGEETEHIKTVDGRIYCPFEAMVQGIDDPTHAYHAIVEKMNRLRRGKPA
ncbi:MAG: DUF1893 domain-containing protein [Candidatus Bathyarchaeota archaeon]|nr:DUF1893 domain-containing protein [Candidatus Bathyarchaeota archaeon]